MFFCCCCCFHVCASASWLITAPWRGTRRASVPPPLGCDASVSLEYWHTSTWLKNPSDWLIYYCQHSLNKSGGVLSLAICAVWVTSAFHSCCSPVTAIHNGWVDASGKQTFHPGTDWKHFSGGTEYGGARLRLLYTAPAGCFLFLLVLSFLRIIRFELFLLLSIWCRGTKHRFCFWFFLSTVSWFSFADFPPFWGCNNIKISYLLWH